MSFSVSLNRLLIKSQLVCPRLQKSPWFLRQTVVTPRRTVSEWWNGVSLPRRSNLFSRTISFSLAWRQGDSNRFYPLHYPLHTSGGVLTSICPLFTRVSSVFRLQCHPRLRRFFALTGWRAARGLTAMLAQKTSSSLTRPTGSPTDGLDFPVKNFSLPRREANFSPRSFGLEFGDQIRGSGAFGRSLNQVIAHNEFDLQTAYAGGRPCALK